MKESKLFSINNKKIKVDASNSKQVPNKFKNNLISLRSLPISQGITGSKSFRQQTNCLTQKISKEKDKDKKNNIIESISFELNSRGKEFQKIKNKNLIMNKKQFLNYNSKINSNYLNYASPILNNGNNTNNINNINNNNGNKPNVFYIQKIEEEPQQLRINTVINTLGPSFSSSANNSITTKNKNKKNINNPNSKLITCLTGWNNRIKGYNTANNTANNSATGSVEKNDKKEFKIKNYKKNSTKKLGKDFLKSKDVIKKINNNIEFNLMQKKNKKSKNKFAHTTNNSRQNSGEKYFEINKSKLLALKHNKLILNNIREINNNNNFNNIYIKNKSISTQATIDNKNNKNNNNNTNDKSEKNEKNEKIEKNEKNEAKEIILKNNKLQTKNHILRKNNQESIKISHTNNNLKSKIKVMNTKINNDNLNLNNIYLKTNIYSNVNIKPNSAFSTRLNVNFDKSQIKVNKSNKMINNNNNIENNNLNKGIIFKTKYKNKNIKNFDIFNVNEESLEIIKNQNQNLFPTSYFFNKLDTKTKKKIMTAGNSPGRDKVKDLISGDTTFTKQKIGEKIISLQKVKQIIEKEYLNKKKNNNLNLKSAHISRKNSANKEFKEYKNIKSENKIISNINFKNDFNCYNYSNPNNTLKSNKSNKSNNSSDKENNNSFIEINFDKNTTNKINYKNSKKAFNSIINVGNNWKYIKNKQLIQINKNINIIDKINRISKGIQIKYNSSNTSKYKLSNKSTNINISNSPISKTKYNNLYEKKKVDVNDNNNNNYYQNDIGIKQINNNLNREKSAGLIKQKEKIKKNKIFDNFHNEIIKKRLINNISSNNSGNINNKDNNKESDNKNKKLNYKKENKNIINKDKIEQLLLNKEKIIKSKKINIEINKTDKEEEYKNKNNNNNNNNENSSKLNNNKIAKKSSHNRNVEQNFIFNSNTNTSLLSTMKDSNYYSHESENLSKYIKDYYIAHSCYPPTDISFYKFGRVIGRGAFGKVNLGLNILTGRIVAIKSFNKKNISNEKAKKKILYETNLMRGLYHPSVTKILETFETDQYMLIIMEYISGGNLQNFVKKRRKLCEKTAKILFRQLIQGIKYIHSKGIVHRDIKLENILLDLNNIVKICDFGVGKITQKGQKLLDQCGTPVYMAPEIIQGEGYEGFPVDIWSAGVALYIMLSGNIPFNRDKTHDLQSAIINLPYKKIDDVSDNANDLLKNILEKNPSKRFNPDQILEHPWMIEHNGNDDDGFDYNYDLEIKNVNKYHLFTNAESILLAKTHIDYRKAPKKDLAENFTIKNLFTLEDKKNNKNIETKSIILAPYNSMLTDSEEEEEEDDEDKTKENKKNKKNKDKDKDKKETIEDIKQKAIAYYNQSTNPYDILDNFNLELEVKNGIIKFHGKVKEFNMNYELNNNEEIDNGMLINSKDDLVVEDSNNEINNEEKLENYVKNNNNNNSIKDINKNKKNHRPSSPYKQPPINKYFVKMVGELGYDENYVIKSLEKNELNHATTIYYLFSNYENIK